MDEYEYKAAKFIMLKNMVSIICTASVVGALYHMSGSWHSLWGLLLAVFTVSTFKTDDTKEKI